MASVPPANGKMIAEADGAIGWLIFNNPARRNAVSMEMWRAVPGILDRFEADPAIRVIVLRGAGDKAFVSGLDISEFADAFSSSATAVGIEEMSARACARVENSPKPTIAMINGFCMGAGIQIASSCDLRVAADTAVLAIPAARLGLGYPADSIHRLVATIGPAHVKDTFFTARQLSAGEAGHMGLVNRVVPAAELESRVRETCAMIAGNAGVTAIRTGRL
jgi:enoyl-CoA hydratase/carnithine racemase